MSRFRLAMSFVLGVALSLATAVTAFAGDPAYPLPK
jgi:hypothetical protein